MKSLDLSVIVPVYNGADTIEAQLDALLAEEYDGEWEVIVVNNASTDATPSIVARYVAEHSRFRTIDALRSHNLSYVRNAGVEAAQANAVAFCDDDDLIGTGWVAAMATALRDHPMVGSRIEYGRLNSASANERRSGFQSTGIGTFFGHPNVSGAGSGYQKWVFEKLGGNDETWDDTGEDFEFSFRAHRDLALDAHFAADAVYHYRRREGALASFRQARRYGRSHVRLFEEFGQPSDREPTAIALKKNLWLLTRIYHLLWPSRRVGWAYKAGLRFGRLEGSLRRRTLFL